MAWRSETRSYRRLVGRDGEVSWVCGNEVRSVTSTPDEPTNAIVDVGGEPVVVTLTPDEVITKLFPKEEHSG